MIELRSGPYRAGKQAEEFLLRRLARGVVPVAQLVDEAEREDIAPATLFRAARRLGVAKPACWALPESSLKRTTEGSKEQAASVEAEGQAKALAPVSNGTSEEVEAAESEATELDPRVEQLVAAARRLMARGQRASSIIHRIRKSLGAELADAVKDELGRS